MPTDEMRAQIETLAAASASLEPTRAERMGWQASADALIGDFFDELATRRTFAPLRPTAIAAFDHEVGQCRSLEELMAAIKAAMAQSGILTAGPGHLGFVPGGGLYVGAVADHFAAALNSFSADAFASPIAAHIHNQAVRWLTALIGYNDSAWGDITSGGSQATLTALCVARNAHGIKPRTYATTCVYLGEHTHHCCEKALDVLFAGDILVRQVPSVDHVMDHTWLSQQIAADVANGLRPWLVIANAGSTNLGRVDPIASIGAVARKYGLWLHVDGAYGGFFKLCVEAAPLFDGLADADSVVLDPHKGMFLPYGCGAVLFKDGRHLSRAFASTGSYMQDRDAEPNQLRSPMDYSLELSRPFRSLRLWLTLQTYGESTLAAALSEKLLMARYAYQRIAALDDIVMMGPLDLSIFAFRLRTPGNGATANDLTQQLLHRINAHQEVFLTSTIVDGYFVIRVAILSFRTHLVTIDALIRIIAEESRELARREA